MWIDRVRETAWQAESPRFRRPNRRVEGLGEQFQEDATAIWGECLGSLDQTAGSTHRAWLAQTRAVSVVGDTLVLAVPDEFVKDWV